MSFADFTPEDFNNFGQGHLPVHLGFEVIEVSEKQAVVDCTIEKHHMAPNGYLHAGTVVSLADTAAGYGCIANLPEGASSFTTVELKTNFLGTAREGRIRCVAKPVHMGRTTQVWDAEITRNETGKTIALFRCTQMILYSK